MMMKNMTIPFHYYHTFLRKELPKKQSNDTTFLSQESSNKSQSFKSTIFTIYLYVDKIVISICK